MIVTDQFVFIHVHKTGGQSLNEAIKQCFPAHREIGYHFPHTEIPEDCRHLPVIGMVRNPWDWYVSWYAFNQKPGIHNPLHHVVSDGSSVGLNATIRNLAQLGSDRPESERHRRALVQLLPDKLDGNKGVGLTKQDLEDLSASNTGYYSWLFNRMMGDTSDDRTHVGRFENLREDFFSILERLSVEEADSLRKRLDDRKRRNVSRHSHYSHYYDRELRQLVNEGESQIIEAYEYGFDSVKAPGASYAFESEYRSADSQSFRKLLGREKHFLRLNQSIDVGAIRDRTEQFPAEKWLESERERLFDVHRDTQALIMVHFEDFQYDVPEYRPLYSDLQNDLQPVLDYIADYYRNNGFIVRLILARLKAGGRIPKHTDAGYSLLNCHRIHLPIITNDDVVFHVGGEEINMRAGELWEINNGTVHGVENRGTEDRVHLIVDWMPNFDGELEKDVLAADELQGADSELANAEMLGSMIARAYKQHQSGQTARAESLYRQVLHFDSNHVSGNNLLGLLCLQTQRFEEAVRHIETALAVEPADAQAHANLGLAYNGLNRTQDAARHFHESLKLNPANPRVYNNLGNIYLSARRVNDAVHCYEQALAIQPAFAEVHFNLGNALVSLRRYAEAADKFQKCIELQPDFAHGKRMLEEARKLAENDPNDFRRPGQA